MRMSVPWNLCVFNSSLVQETRSKLCTHQQQKAINCLKQLAQSGLIKRNVHRRQETNELGEKMPVMCPSLHGQNRVGCAIVCETRSR